ncbi:hypothetical protein NC651_002793 [Populus alba x Populus x berolinensis]|nr:hypothetical protein NC651_002793 [Populus alba x Populus x berolinensis]
MIKRLNLVMLVVVVPQVSLVLALACPWLFMAWLIQPQSIARCLLLILCTGLALPRVHHISRNKMFNFPGKAFRCKIVLDDLQHVFLSSTKLCR